MNLFVVKGKKIYKSHYIFVEFYPLIHFVPANISYHVINVFESNSGWIIIRFPWFVSWQENAVIIFSFYKNMDGFAIRINSRPNHFAAFIFFDGWFHKRTGATFHGFVIGTCGVFNPKRNHFYAIAMFF